MLNVSEDLSTLTTIPKTSIDKLSELTENYMLHEINENVNNFEILTEFNIGYGIISILIDDDNIKYKFTPRKSFEEKLIEVVKYNKDFFVEDIENKLEGKLLNAYKDLL